MYGGCESHLYIYTHFSRQRGQPASSRELHTTTPVCSCVQLREADGATCGEAVDIFIPNLCSFDPPKLRAQSQSQSQAGATEQPPQNQIEHAKMGMTIASQALGHWAIGRGKPELLSLPHLAGLADLGQQLQGPVAFAEEICARSQRPSPTARSSTPLHSHHTRNAFFRGLSFGQLMEEGQADPGQRIQ